MWGRGIDIALKCCSHTICLCRYGFTRSVGSILGLLSTDLASKPMKLRIPSLQPCTTHVAQGAACQSQFLQGALPHLGFVRYILKENWHLPSLRTSRTHLSAHGIREPVRSGCNPGKCQPFPALPADSSRVFIGLLGTVPAPMQGKNPTP